MAKNVSWRQILVACGYEIVQRSRPTHKKMAACKLRPTGDEYYIHCFYHPEETASLHLMPFGFHCFGCGETDGKLRFVIDRQQLRTSREVKQFFTAALNMCKE